MATDPVTRMEQGLKLVNLVFMAAVAATIIAVLVIFALHPDTGQRAMIQKILFGAWTLGPPVGLVAQHLVWPPAIAEIERFRTQQALIKAVWAGIVGFLAASFFGHWG